VLLTYKFETFSAEIGQSGRRSRAGANPTSRASVIPWRFDGDHEEVNFRTHTEQMTREFRARNWFCCGRFALRPISGSSAVQRAVHNVLEAP